MATKQSQSYKKASSYQEIASGYRLRNDIFKYPKTIDASPLKSPLMFSRTR
jgi:hypothetical protein